MSIDAKGKQPVIGQPFNPCREACGFYPPDVVARQRDLTDGQKRLYERSVRWSGRNGIFWHSFATIAEALGKSVRQVKSDMAKLEEKGFIAHDRRGRRQSNLYRFLWHSIFDIEVQPTVRNPPGNIPIKTGREVQSAAPHESNGEVQHLSGEVQPTAHEFSPLNFVPNCVQQLQADYCRRLARTGESPADLGIGTTTLTRWLQLPEFDTAYRRVRRAAHSQSLARLQQGSSAAATTLLKTMIDPNTPASVRVRAAECVLNQATKGIETEDILARVEELERAAETAKSDQRRT